ncbi:DUF1353 domain-containing protein [Leisingera daeponensis]|uniref:DUF1353 domain-containing protein n=1 Tax=Leisingera daeponensis TaxID=405746 RepID=UPI0006851070|nr:DUF1353 domain-containing protein [Leisingera daeponensis]
MKNRKIRFVAALFLALPQPAFSQEFFGLFTEGPKGEFHSAEPWTVFKLGTDFHFDDPNGLRWTTPAGAEVNGASIPPAFWSFIGGPFTGRYLKASVIHDYYTQVQTRTAHDTHRNFYYGMRANGVEDWRAKLMYWAVRTFGPSWTVERSVVQSQECTEISGNLVCNSVSNVVTKTVPQAVANLEDPEQLTFALAKFAAVARTLKTSDGIVLDVTENGQVFASLSSIEANAESLSKHLSATTPLTKADLGLMASWEGLDLNNVPVWANNELPELKNVPTFEPVHDFVPIYERQRDLNAVAREFDFPADAFRFQRQDVPG